MPSALPYDDDDPVVASYDVYMTKPLPRSNENTTEIKSDTRLLVLQYPSHRALNAPYNNATSQKPTRLRIKPHTGLVEVEIPILTHKHFNHLAGRNYGKSLADSRLSHSGGSHGLAGGFSSAPVPAQHINLDEIPAYGEESDNILSTQTLGGKIVVPSERDPVYMLGSFRNNELHLTQLDAVVQMRPQLHHIDAEEERISRQKYQTQMGASGKMKVGLEAPARLETKAIELKMKDNKDDSGGRGPNVNAKLLRNIQADQWRSHDWIDEGDQESWYRAEAYTTLREDADSTEKARHLQSMLTNDDWLDKMSVVREDGRKGLRAKLKGRDRERARRKKVEHQRRQMNMDNVGAPSRVDISSGSDLSSLSEQSDIEMVDQSTGPPEVDIKEEVGNAAATPASKPSVPDAGPTTTTTTTSAPKRRGRPRKT